MTGRGRLVQVLALVLTLCLLVGGFVFAESETDAVARQEIPEEQNLEPDAAVEEAIAAGDLVAPSANGEGDVPCAHENLDSGVEYADGEYTAIDVYTHKVESYAYTWYYCPDCDEAWSDAPDGEKTEATERHDFFNGVCNRCGYKNTCAHERVEASVDFVEAEYTAIDARTHKVAGYAYTLYYCPDCDEFWEGAREDEKTEVTQDHFFVDGVCVQCGYKNTCSHANVESWTEYADVTYVPVDARKHMLTGYAYTYHYCHDCGESWEDARASEKSEILQNHDFCDGFCEGCGYENQCAHEHTTEYTRFEDAEYTKVTAERHTQTGKLTHYRECVDCGEVSNLYTEGELSSRSERHSFVNGVCECGYVNACTHPADKIRTDTFGVNCKYGNITEDGHELIGSKVVLRYCAQCHQTLSEEYNDESVCTFEPHGFFISNVCDCGYVNPCTHPADAIETIESFDSTYTEYTCIDSETHSGSGPRIRMTFCNLCDQVLSWEEIGEDTRVENHNYMDNYVEGGNVCTRCGYVRAEAEATPAPTPEATPAPTMPVASDEPIETPVPTEVPTEAPTDTPVPTEAPTEAPTQAPTETPVPTEVPTEAPTETPVPTEVPTEAPTETPVPTEAPTETPTELPTETPTMPAVSDEPAVTPTAKPAATKKPANDPTPAPAYVEVPVEAGRTIAETMMLAGDAAEAEGAIVEIVNAGKLLTAEELSALEALPAREQLLTFLSVMGFEEQVNRALAAAEEELSAEAVALKERILMRIDAMGDGERSAFDELLRTCFPQETIRDGGAEYRCFVLELELRTGDALRRERYGFRQEGEEWIFIRLEIAG